MELNREQIIKALEICTGTEQDYYCTNIPCPYGDVGSCQQLLMAHAFALIKELTEENERLRAEVSVKKKLLDKCVNLEDKVRADTVRKMQVRLKEKAFSVPTVYNSHFGRMVDQIAKEMLEDK